jgi:hypothetical protein
MIEKKDWERLLKELKDRQTMMNMAVEQDKALIELAEKKIKEFPEEKDDAPKDIKEIIDAVK